MTNNLSIDLIHQIYEYLPFGMECLLCKDVYECKKTKLIQEFYKGEPCLNEATGCNSCGHSHITHLFTWKEVVGMVMDDDFGHYDKVIAPMKMEMCKTCFTISFYKTYKQLERVPYLRNDGSLFFHYARKLRETVSEKEFLSTISNSEYQALETVVFPPINGYVSVYRSDYYNRKQYENILKPWMETIQPVKLVSDN